MSPDVWLWEVGTPVAEPRLEAKTGAVLPLGPGLGLASFMAAAPLKYDVVS